MLCSCRLALKDDILLLVIVGNCIIGSRFFHSLCLTTGCFFQVSQLQSRVQQTLRTIAEVTDVKHSWNVIHFLQSKVHGLERHPMRLPLGASERAWREDVAMFLHDLKLALQLVTWHASPNLYLLCRVLDAKEVVQ